MEKTMLEKYVEFCKNSKFKPLSKLLIDPWYDEIQPRVLAMESFKFPDTGIRRIRRFLKYIGVTVNFATIPLNRPDWEYSFSLLDDVKYDSSEDSVLNAVPETCTFFFDENTEVATVTDTGKDAVMAIDLSKLNRIINERKEQNI
jgi:hypothetical protein